MQMPVAGGPLDKDLSQESAVVLLSTSGVDSKKAGMEAAVLESSYVLRLVKKCTLLECGAVAGDFGNGDSLLHQSQYSFYFCAMALNIRTGWRQLHPQAWVICWQGYLYGPL